MGNKQPQFLAESDPKWFALGQGDDWLDPITYDPNESYAVCVGIDEQVEKELISLGEMVANDTEALVDRVSRNLGLPKANVKNLVASRTSKRLVTSSGISVFLVDAAQKVGRKGILVFSFSGHGAKINGKYGLVTYGHSASRSDILTGKDFVRLILEETDFKGKRVLLVLDCCSAGGIPEEFFGIEDARKTFCTVAACRPNEASIQLHPLNHSVFTYFLLEALHFNFIANQASRSTAELSLNLQKIYKLVSEASFALSALFIKFDSSKKSLVGYNSHAVVISGKGKEEVDSDPMPHRGRFESLLRLGERYPEKAESFPYCRRWLDYHIYNSSSLIKLRDLDCLGKPAVFEACLSAMCHSIACIHIYENSPTMGKANQFIFDFISVFSSLEVVAPVNNQRFSASKFGAGLVYYFSILKKHKVDVSQLDDLFEKVKNKYGRDETDSVSDSNTYIVILQ